MDTQSNPEEYVLVLEDRSKVEKPGDVGTLSVISGIDDEGNVLSVEAKDTNQSAFIRFNKNDSAIASFFKNLMQQFREPTHFGVYRILNQKVEDSVAMLRTMLAERDNPMHKSSLDAMMLRQEDFEPEQKLPAINPSKVDWKSLESIGLSKEKLDRYGYTDDLLNHRKTPLVHIAIPLGDSLFHTEARLALRQDKEGNFGLSVHGIRKEPNLNSPYMGHTFSDEEREALKTTGNLGKVIELKPKEGEAFKAYVSIDPLTNELVALKSERISVPREINGVRLSDEQFEKLSNGEAVRVEGMTAKSGKVYDATLQINAEKKGIAFKFDNDGQNQKQSEERKYGVPTSIAGVQLTEKQQKSLSEGKTLFVQNMTNRKQQTTFNSYIRYNKDKGKYEFVRQKQEQGADQKQAEKASQTQTDKPSKKRGPKM